jgi:hypothetical protein
VSGNTLVAAAGSNAKVGNASGPAITLASSGNKVQHVNASSSGGPAVAGTNVDTATVDAGTTLSGTNGGVAIDGGSGAISIGSAISTTGGHSVSVQNRTGGSVTFDGTVNDTGTGIRLFNNGVSAVTFTKTITGSTGTSPAFSATGGGTVSATASGSTLTTTTGIALDVRNNTIDNGGLKFQSISANGAPNGIRLDTTGSSGSLTVSGTGTANTGGTIQNTTGHGISLNDTQGVSLTDIRVQNPQHAGIKGANVHGFALIDSTVTGAGSALTDTTDSSLAFNDTSAATPNNLDGVVTVTNNTLSGAYGGGIDVANYTGTISNATISNNTISSSTSPAASKGSGIALNLFGTASTVASLTKASITANTLTNFPSGDGISVQGGNTSGAGAPPGTYGVPSGSVPGIGANLIDISSNHVTGDATNKLNGAGISASVTGRGQGNFSITNNGGGGQPITNVKAEAIALGAAGNVNANFLVTGNTAVANNVLGSSGIGLGTDINQQADLSTNTSDTPVVNANIASNSIAGSSGPGIRVLTRDSSGTTNLRVSNNTVGSPAQAATAGIRLDAGSSGNALYNPTVCAEVLNNSASTGPSNSFGDVTSGIVLFKRSASATTYKFGLTGLSPSPATAAQSEAYVAGNNSGSAVGAGFYAGKKATVVAGDQFTSCTLGF